MDRKGTIFRLSRNNLPKTVLFVLLVLAVLGCSGGKAIAQRRTCYQDIDEDGFGNPDVWKQKRRCRRGWVENNQDCDDTDWSIKPTAATIPGNLVDEDCNGILAGIGSPTPTDLDGDGIPNTEEEIHGTDPSKKTLFVKPTRRTSSGDAYWGEFTTTIFPHPTKPGYAEIPALTQAGVEVVVIGAPGHSHGRDKYNYNPVGQNIHCDIMEVVHHESYCTVTATCNKAVGHTYFFSGTASSPPSWSWDTKGYTPATIGTLGYREPRVYQLPLDNYFKEGAYNGGIAVNSTPTTLMCSLGSPCSYRSPMNLNDIDPPPNPPYTVLPDGTVEFNEISFDATTGEISTIGSPGAKYVKNDVLRRTLVHEMGHALTGLHHCDNPSCIMYRYTVTWQPYGFGGMPGECEHSPGNVHDIRTYGGYHTMANGQEIKFGVYNRIHP